MPQRRAKVVGVGLNKTGTTTLGACLRHWSFRHRSWDREAFGLWLEGRHDELLAQVDDYDSFEDFPWLLLYREIDARHPGSKFILTRRKDAEAWFRSICRHAEWTGPHEVNRHVYGHALPKGHKEHHVAFYQSYLRQVREFFAARPADFLEVCWEEGDGWRVLAEFLGRDLPEIPFPHANKSPNALKLAVHRVRRYKWKLWQSAGWS